MENFKLSSSVIVVPTVDATSHDAAKAVVLEKYKGYKRVMVATVYQPEISRFDNMLNEEDFVIALGDESVTNQAVAKAMIQGKLDMLKAKKQAILDLEDAFLNEGVVSSVVYNTTWINPKDSKNTVEIQFLKTGREEPEVIEFIEAVVNYDKVANELIAIQTDLKLADERKAIIENKFLKLSPEKQVILEKICGSLIASGEAIGTVIDEMNLLIGSTSSTSKTAVSVEAPEGMQSVPGSDMKFFAKIDKEVIANGSGQAAFIGDLFEYFEIKNTKLDKLQSWGDTQNRINKILAAANKPIPVYSVSIGKGKGNK